MKRVPIATAVLAAALLAPTFGDTTRSSLRDADLAWERGDYVIALTAYLQLLDSPGAGQMLEPIALQTGELYHTIELTPDGADPQFSPDGRYISYEQGTGVRRTTRILTAADPTTTVADLRGWGAAFAPDGSRVAYLTIAGTPAVYEAEAAVERATTVPERTQRAAALGRLVSFAARIRVRELASGQEHELNTENLGKSSLAFGAGGAVLFSGAPPETEDAQIHIVAGGGPPRALTSGPGDKTVTDISPSGEIAIVTPRTGGGRGGRAAGGAGPVAPASFGVLSVADGRFASVAGSAPSLSADARTVAYIARENDEYRVMAAPTGDPATGTIVRRGPERVDAPALAPDGSRVAFQMMSREDWEIFVVSRDGSEETRVTREIQHDLLPRFLSGDRLLAVIGEARHRRSYLYDLTTGTRARLFHNNTVRTIAPEYAWVPDSSGTKVLIVAERDGDTVSPQRGVYLMDLSRRVTRDELKRRVETNLAAEQALRAKGRRIYEPIAAAVADVVNQASVDRVYAYGKALYDLDSKHITKPGNRLAGEYLFEQYRSFGYEPEYQWFEARGALGGRTANVLATLKGTVNPELVYVVSSHYDSVAVGPGADDNSSGTAALLETARMLAKHPQPATIIFASFTGEESGLLGSREFVRRAIRDRVQLVGALNNDMVGWANDQRLDNTIRYSNVGIRDIQHAAAIQFTRLITYDALYYKSTDAAAYYEAYGDIVGGIGSYPVLGNPHYHQSHDVLETINHQLVTEVAKTTAATLMLLASSPSRLTGLTVHSLRGGTATLSWRPSPERGVTGYIVAYGPPDNPQARQVRVATPTATLGDVTPGMMVMVKAVNDKHLEGWDWARIPLGGEISIF